MFNSFWAWHRADKPSVVADSKSPLGLLTMKLRGRSLLKSVEAIKSATGVTGEEKKESQAMQVEQKINCDSKLLE